MNIPKLLDGLVISSPFIKFIVLVIWIVVFFGLLILNNKLLPNGTLGWLIHLFLLFVFGFSFVEYNEAYKRMMRKK